jgi:chromosome segregation protein
VEGATEALALASEAFEAAEEAQEVAIAQAEEAEALLEKAEVARAETQGREAEARAARSAAEGEANALRAEVAALARLVEREARQGHSFWIGWRWSRGSRRRWVRRWPMIFARRRWAATRSGWAMLADYDAPQGLPVVWRGCRRM